MKTLIASLFLMAYSFSAKGQIVEIASSNQGLIVPRVASTANVSSPSAGTIVFQTGGSVGLYVYNGSTWTALGTGGGGGVSVPQMLTSFTGMFGTYERFAMMGQTNRIIEAETQFRVPRSGTIKNLCARNAASLDSGSSISVFFRKNGSDTALTHVFTPSDALGSVKCSNGATTVSVIEGDLITMRYIETQGVDPGSVYILCTMEFE